MAELLSGATALHSDFLALAFLEAQTAAQREEVPVGAVLMAADGTLLAASGNRIVELRDPTAHAEILVIRAAAAKLGTERLVGSSLYVTLEPCAMCAGAISMARIAKVVFAAKDPKGGAVLHGPKFFEQPTCHHRPQIVHAEGEWESKSAQVLREFFRARRSTLRLDEEASLGSSTDI
ncbi:MAG TPA: tRNA-specific adenosine deaminase [Alphaproteobacteria bacterium]|nr:tRNA-specific adenosine deaminase [Alphaproteobacteria bacterium]HAJ46050.1 tRNA-specific adenosine deaminase [Alphaproteobacteria bacterium]